MTTPDGRTLRVAQWAMGNVGVEAVKAILAHPDLSLVGAYAYSPTKVGVDVGTSCDLGRQLDVLATGDVDALLATRPHCVVYTPLHFDVEEVTHILRSGVNIVTSAEFMTGSNLGEVARDAVENAGRDGEATIFGSGMNPGYAQLAAAICSGVSTRVSKASMTESVDVSQFIGDANFAAVGWGRPKDDRDHAAAVRRGTAVFAEAVEVFARLMRVDLEDIGCAVDFAHATEDVVSDGVSIPSGHVGGIDVRWYGLVDGAEVVSIDQRWIATRSLSPAWTVDHGYRVEITGDPNVLVKIDLMPTDEDLADLTPARMRGIGLRITAGPLVNAIPVVCAARPGIATYAELPAIAAAVRPR